MFWHRKREEPRFTLDDFNKLYAMVADKVVAMNEEARKANMVELGLLPQSHLSRADKEKNLHKLQNDGHVSLGRSVGQGDFTDDPDLTARDD